MCHLYDDEFWARLQEDNSHIPQAKFVLVEKYISKRCAEIFGKEKKGEVVFDVSKAGACTDFPA